jgi:hypothetical protein
MTDPQTFKLLDPAGEVIMTGSLDALMERLPDTPARDAALETAIRVAAEAVEAEERADEARACAARSIADTITRLTERLDAEEQRREEQQRQDEEEAQLREQEEIEHMLDELPDPDDPDPLTAAGDDGDLETKLALSPEKYGVEEDADADAVPLSYGKVPESYVKGEEAQDPVGIGGATDPEPDLEALGKAKDPEADPTANFIVGLVSLIAK